MERVIELNGNNYHVKTEYLFDLTVDGVTYGMTDLGFFDPELHKTFGFTTVASVIKWWIEHRVEILQQIPAQFENWFREAITGYFYLLPYATMCHVTFDYEVAKSLLQGHLRSPSLNIVINTPSVDGGFMLCDQEDTITVHNCYLTCNNCCEAMLFHHGERSGSSSSKWNKMYNYSFKMTDEEFDWYRSVSKESSVYFGMELEISTALSNKELQHIVTEVEPKQEPFFIFKQDGSVSGQYSNRVEIVTVPCTPRYLRKNFKLFFNKIHKLCEAKSIEVSSVFDTRTDLTNGLHIHVDRNSFVNKSHFNKFLAAWNQWDTSVVALFNSVSGRPFDYTTHEYCHIAHSYLTTKPAEGKPTLAKFEKRKHQRSLARRLKGIRTDERHSVCHDRSGSTAEVRVFQGIFDLSHVMQSISFTEAVFEYCGEVGYSGFDSNFIDAFTNFITKQRKFASLYTTIEKGKAACA